MSDIAYIKTSLFKVGDRVILDRDNNDSQSWGYLTRSFPEGFAYITEVFQSHKVWYVKVYSNIEKRDMSFHQERFKLHKQDLISEDVFIF